MAIPDNLTADNQILDASLRRVIATNGAAFVPYDRYAVARDDMAWLPLGDAHDTPGGGEIFLLRLKPGAVSTPHEHIGGEAFYVLDGEITDCDGRVFGGGDYVCYQPGSRHYSISEKGCTLLVLLGGRNVATKSAAPSGDKTAPQNQRRQPQQTPPRHG